MADRKRTDYLVVHVSATKRSQQIGRAELVAMHKARGFADIGYNSVINLDGRREKGRGDNAIGAHVEGFNSIAWGTVIIGGMGENGKPSNTMTAEQEAALEQDLRRALKLFPNARIAGHRDLSPDKDGDGVIEASEWTKMCPCFNVIPWAIGKGLPAANIRGPWDGASPAQIRISRPEGPDERNIYLQRLLAKAGFQFGAIDGHIGPKTKAAIALYQKFAGLPQTGVFDVNTVKRLRYAFEKLAA
jgi:N-acetyl-anhydromuramyl-L-alanine amidase AmpD